MDVSHQLEEIGILLAENRLVPIMKEVAVPPVPVVEDDGVTREKTSHHGGDGHATRLEKQMDMVRHESPSETGCSGLLKDSPESVDKRPPIRVIGKDLPAFDSPKDDMVKSARGVNTSLAWHTNIIAHAEDVLNLYYYGRPLIPYGEGESFDIRADRGSHRILTMTRRSASHGLAVLKAVTAHEGELILPTLAPVSFLTPVCQFPLLARAQRIRGTTRSSCSAAAWHVGSHFIRP
jgi:hypothetical protein